jgi:Ca-activated chloride channel homolog
MRRFLLTCVLVCSIAHSAFAIGALFSRPLRSDQTYNQVWIKTVDATVQIEGQVAVTHVDQVFKNEMNQTVEAVWIFPLPEGAVMTELYYWFNGHRYKGSVRELEEARHDYNESIRQRIDPALLEYLGNNLFRLSIAPINALTDVRTEITFVQLMTYEFGRIQYNFLLNAVGLSPKPLNRVSMSGSFKTQTPIKFFRSPSHGTSTELAIFQSSDYRYDFVFGDENFMPSKDLIFEYETFHDDVQMQMLRYTPVAQDSIGSDSFYIVWITPPDSVGGNDAIPKKMVFTVDVSSSMEGERLHYLKRALLTFLQGLTPNDYFNIITFGTSVVPFRSDLVAATSSEIDAAVDFVNDVGAAGLTNISDALKKSLSQSFSADYANMLVFLTDGLPTWGETAIPNILSAAKQQNTQNVRIFTFGVGKDVSKSLLTQLALENGGYATYLTESTDIELITTNHLKRMSKPVLTNLNIDIDGLATADKFPKILPDLFWGSQVMQVGLYRNNGVFPVTLRGTMKDKSMQFHSVADFSKVPGGYAFVPRLWARAKIDYLLEQIAIYGEIAELKNQVIELSIRFQILTPYTAFYADPNDPHSAVDKSREKEIPAAFTLHQNYPNPFNAGTTISFELREAGHVTIKVYDLLGRLVSVLVDQDRTSGAYQVKWNAIDDNQQTVASGVYIYIMEFTTADGQKITWSYRMSLVR